MTSFKNPTGGLGDGGGVKLGPEQNVFTGADLAAAESARDVYAGANPVWLQSYNDNVDLAIRLEYEVGGEPAVQYQSRNAAGTLWAEVESAVAIKGDTGAPGATGNSYFFSSVAARDSFFSTSPNEGLLETDLPIKVNIGNDTVASFIWKGTTSPASYDSTLWHNGSDATSTSGLQFGESSKSNVAAGNNHLLYTDGDGDKGAVIDTKYDNSGSSDPTYPELATYGLVPLAGVFDTQLNEPQELTVVINNEEALIDITLRPAEAGELKIEIWLDNFDSNKKLVDQYFTIESGDVGNVVALNFKNDLFIDSSTNVYIRMSEIELFGGLQTSGPFTGQTTVFAIIGAQIITRQTVSSTQYVDDTIGPVEDLADNAQTTGWLSGGVITQASSTALNITASTGQIVDLSAPSGSRITPVSLDAQNGYTIQNLTPDGIIWIAYTDTNQVIEITDEPDQDKYKNYIILGSVKTYYSTVLANSITPPLNVGNGSAFAGIDGMKQLIKASNVRGNVFGNSGGGLTISNTGGEIFSLGCNTRIDINNPHIRNIPPTTTCLFFRGWRNSSGKLSVDTAIPTSQINVAAYNPNGAGSLSTIPSGYFSVQHIYISREGVYYVIYGQEIFETLGDAAEAINNGTLEFDEPSSLDLYVPRGYLIFQRAANNLSYPEQAEFIHLNNIHGTGIAANGTDQVSAYRKTSGQVKVNSYGAGLLKPSATLITTSPNTATAWQAFNWDLPLNFSSSPTNQFPIMDPIKGDASIWDDTNGLLRENNSVGQQHLWRIQLQLTRAAAFAVVLEVRLTNPVSGFEVDKRIQITNENSGLPETTRETIDIETIADAASLPVNRGYQLEVRMYGDNNSTLDIEVEALTRFSFANSNTDIII